MQAPRPSAFSLASPIGGNGSGLSPSITLAITPDFPVIWEDGIPSIREKRFGRVLYPTQMLRNG